MKTYPQPVLDMLETGHIEFAYLIKIDFEAAPLHFALCGHNVVYNGTEYISTSLFQGMDALSRSSSMEVTEMNMSFSMADPTMLSIVLNNDIEFTPVIIGRVYLGVVNQVMYYEKVWSGRVTSNGDDEEEGILTLTVSNSWADFENANPYRTNPQSQERRHQGDNCFKFAAKAGETIYWGGELAGGGRASGSGGKDNNNQTELK